MRTLFHILETVGHIVPKLFMWLDTYKLHVLHRDPLARRLTELNGGVYVRDHVCTCAPRFRISGTAGRIPLKIGGVWLGDHQLYTLHRMEETFSSARFTVHILAHLFVPAPSSPKRRLTGYDN